jgi:hypothetical protein
MRMLKQQRTWYQVRMWRMRPPIAPHEKVPYADAADAADELGDEPIGLEVEDDDTEYAILQEFTELELNLLQQNEEHVPRKRHSRPMDPEEEIKSSESVSSKLG